MFNELFSKIMPFMRQCGKYFRSGRATDDSTAHDHCMLGNYGYKHTLITYNTYCFPTATTVARTRLNVTLYGL